MSKLKSVVTHSYGYVIWGLGCICLFLVFYLPDPNAVLVVYFGAALISALLELIRLLYIWAPSDKQIDRGTIHLWVVLILIGALVWPLGLLSCFLDWLRSEEHNASKPATGGAPENQ